jgi:hypothetical protein
MNKLLNFSISVALIAAGMMVEVAIARYAETVSIELKFWSWLLTGALIGAGIGMPFKHPLRGALVGLAFMAAYWFITPTVR